MPSLTFVAHSTRLSHRLPTVRLLPGTNLCVERGVAGAGEHALDAHLLVGPEDARVEDHSESIGMHLGLATFLELGRRMLLHSGGELFGGRHHGERATLGCRRSERFRLDLVARLHGRLDDRLGCSLSTGRLRRGLVALARSHAAEHARLDLTYPSHVDSFPPAMVALAGLVVNPPDD